MPFSCKSLSDTTFHSSFQVSMSYSLGSTSKLFSGLSPLAVKCQVNLVGDGHWFMGNFRWQSQNFCSRNWCLINGLPLRQIIKSKQPHKGGSAGRRCAVDCGINQSQPAPYASLAGDGGQNGSLVGQRNLTFLAHIVISICVGEGNFLKTETSFMLSYVFESSAVWADCSGREAISCWLSCQNPRGVSGFTAAACDGSIIIYYAACGWELKTPRSPSFVDFWST